MERSLEAGVRRVFVLLVGYWILYWLAITPLVWLTSGGPPVLAMSQYALLIVLNSSVIIMLLWPGLALRLGRMLLPLSLGICTVSFFIEKFWFLQLGNNAGATQGQLMHAHLVRQDFVLLLLLVAWQYRYRIAVAFALGITALEWVMVSLADLSNPLLSGITNRELIVRCVIFLLIAHAVNWLVQRQRLQRAELIRANTRLAGHAAMVEQLAASHERNRLARELHDTLAHSLSALSVQIEAVDSLWDVNAPAARAMLGNAGNTARDGLHEARRTLQALRATPLENFGLATALSALGEAAASRCGASFSMHCPDPPPLLPGHVEHAVYRIAQEALENAARHSAAKSIRLALAKTGSQYSLQIEDDGSGFEPTPPTHGRLGLRGMVERATAMGGTFEISSRPAQGTTVSLRWEDARPHHE